MHAYKTNKFLGKHAKKIHIKDIRMIMGRYKRAKSSQL